jgi:hypothetical protein
MARPPPATLSTSMERNARRAPGVARESSRANVGSDGAMYFRTTDRTFDPYSGTIGEGESMNVMGPV